MRGGQLVHASGETGSCRRVRRLICPCDVWDNCGRICVTIPLSFKRLAAQGSAPALSSAFQIAAAYVPLPIKYSLELVILLWFTILEKRLTWLAAQGSAPALRSASRTSTGAPPHSAKCRGVSPICTGTTTGQVQERVADLQRHHNRAGAGEGC